MSENRSCLLTVEMPLRIVCAGTLQGGDVNMVRHRLTDQQWELVQDLFPPPARAGRPRRDRREILDGVLGILRTGAPWRDLPEGLGPWATTWRHDRDDIRPTLSTPVLWMTVFRHGLDSTRRRPRRSILPCDFRSG